MTNSNTSERPSVSRRNMLHALGLLGFGASLSNLQAAQSDWPNKSVRFVVPFAPGGSSEIVARSTAAELSATLGSNVYVENKPGAAGNIAMQEVARARDHHTLILGHLGTLAVNPFIFQKLPYDPNADFKPVSLLAKVPSLYVISPTVPAKNLNEFVAYAKSKHGQLSYGTAGNGSAGHLAFEYLKISADIDMMHVPYKGTGPMMTDLLTGRVEASAIGAAAILPFIQSGKVRCIATGSSQRLPLLPDVPTVVEQGFPGFEMTQWYGMLAPANIEPEHLSKLSTETMKAVKSPNHIKRMTADSAESIGDTPEQFAAFIASEQMRWKKVIERAGIQPA